MGSILWGSLEQRSGQLYATLIVVGSCNQLLQLFNLEIFTRRTKANKISIQAEPVSNNTEGEEVSKYSLQFPDYSDQAIRLQSFKHWGGVLPAQELAEGGFYMIARRDRVKCFSCNVVLYDWEKSDNVINEHRKHSPKCHFLKELTCKSTSEQSTNTVAIIAKAKDFQSSWSFGSLPPNDNQEAMIPGTCHYPRDHLQQESLSDASDYSYSPTQSLDSHSGSPRIKQFEVSCVKVIV